MSSDLDKIKDTALKIEEECEALSVLDEYRFFVYLTDLTHNRLDVHILGLVAEVGELCGKINKSERDDTPLDRDGIVLELGDVLWQLTAVCEDLGIGLDEVMATNVRKLADRYSRKALKGSGDYR